VALTLVLVGGLPLATWAGARTLAVHAAATSGAAGKVDTFIRGQDNQLWHRAFDGTAWSAWEPLGGVLTADPAAIATQGGLIDVFTRGQDHGLWHRAFSGTAWGQWEALGGAIDSGPTVASWAPGHFDVFALGLDEALWHRTFDQGAWRGWESLHGGLTSNPSAVSWGPGRMDIFARGQDNALWHLDYANQWGSWQSLGGILSTGPGVASWAAGHLDVFGIGQDRQLWQRTWTGAVWTPWAPHGGILTSDPSAVSSADGRIDVFARGQDNAQWHLGFTGGWGSWEFLGGIVAAGTDPMTFPVPVYRQAMNLDCETAALQMALAAMGHYYSQSELFALENPDTRPPVMGPNRTVVRWGNPYTNFVGNVNGSDSTPTGYGIYYPLILSIAQSHGAPAATGGENVSAGLVYASLAANHPVEVWTEVGWLHPRLGTWTAWDGRPIRYSLDEHTVILSGLTATQVRVNDPWHGTQYWISKATFEASWADFNYMAVIFG
jgi:uncharacterized protein YvpB